MAGASTTVYEFDSVVRGQHIYKSVWTSLIDRCSKTQSASLCGKTMNAINML